MEFLLFLLLGLGVGIFGTLVGIGGGIIHVPLMIYLLGFPVHIATATSHFVLAVSSCMGVISHFLLDHIVWLPAIALGIGASLGAQIGAKLSKKTKPKIILVLLSCAVFAPSLTSLPTYSAVALARETRTSPRARARSDWI